MPKTTTPDAERTRKRILAEYAKGVKPGALAQKYGISVNTIKSWIRRGDKTPRQETGAKGRVQSGAKGEVQTGVSRKRTGAPIGNTNAVGNPGGAAPLGNKNALKHGGYSPAYWDTLTEEERELLAAPGHDTERLLQEEIDLLSVRERRIMARIRKLTQLDEKAPGGMGQAVSGGMGQAVSGVMRTEEKREFDSPEDKALYEEIQRAKIDSGKLLPGRKYTVTTRTEATYDVIHRLEDALTRCQAQKQRCIRNLMELRSMPQEIAAGGDTAEVEALIDAIKRESGGGNPLAAE